jgi:hypothetical protein
MTGGPPPRAPVPSTYTASFYRENEPGSRSDESRQAPRVDNKTVIVQIRSTPPSGLMHHVLDGQVSTNGAAKVHVW